MAGPPRGLAGGLRGGKGQGLGRVRVELGRLSQRR
jgi:hypothetical protein